MDARFYPAEAGSSLPSNLDFAQCLGYYNKFGSNNNYMNMAEADNAFLATNQDQSHTRVSQYCQNHSLIMRSIIHMTDAAHLGIMSPSQLTTINQSQLSVQLGLYLGDTNLPHTSPSPPASKSATPSSSSSINEEDADESNRAAAESAEAQTVHSVQQTLASTNLSSSLILNTFLSQHATVSASPQTLQQPLPRIIAPKPLTMRLPMNQTVASVAIAPNKPTKIAAPLINSMGTNMVAMPSSSQVSSSMQSQQHQIQQLQQQQMQQMQQQQLHQHQMHQKIQQEMQQQHFQHHVQHLHQQKHLQQQVNQQQMQQQLQHMQLQQMQQQQMQHIQYQSQPSPQQHSPVASQISSPIPAIGSTQPAHQQHQSQIQSQTQTQVLSQLYLQYVNQMAQ